MITRLLQAAFFIGVGLFLIVKRRDVEGWFGGFDFAEKWFGGGGSLLFLILVGSACVFIGVVLLAGGTDVVNSVITGMFQKEGTA